MKCRFETDVDANATHPAVVIANRDSVVGLGVSLTHDDRVILFAICVEFPDNPGSFYWGTLWTRSKTDGRVRINPEIFYWFTRLNTLDRRVVLNVVQYVSPLLDLTYLCGQIPQ